MTNDQAGDMEEKKPLLVPFCRKRKRTMSQLDPQGV